jgi:O-antigen/teichoic acid export membrane protein
MAGGVSSPSADGKTFGNALKWSYVMDIGRQATTLLVTFILAGVLGPKPYGVVAMATVYIAFLQLLLAQGMLPAIIQRRNLKPEHTDAAFWMVLTLSLVLTLLTIPLSSWWADVNNTPQLGPVVLALSLVLPIEGLKVVQEALMRRDLNIRPLAVRTNASVMAGAVVGVVLALVWRNVWALVVQQLVTAVVDVVVLWAYSNWRPRLRFKKWAAKDLLSFSMGSSAASLGVFFNARSDVLITGLFFGQTAVGLYRFASRLVDTAVSVTITSLQGASLPELSRNQHDPDRFAERIVTVSRASALLALPVLGVLAGCADPLIDAVGPEWQRAAAPLAVLCIMGAGQSMTVLVGPMLQALGKTSHLAAFAWLSAILSGGAFIIAGTLLRDSSVGDQVLTMAWSRALLYGLVFLGINLAILKHFTGVPAIGVLRAAFPSALAALSAAALGVSVAMALEGIMPPLLRLALTGGLCAATAGLIVYSTDPVVRGGVGQALAKAGWGGYSTAAHAPSRRVPFAAG